MQDSYTIQDIRFELLDEKNYAGWNRTGDLCLLLVVTGNVRINTAYGHFALQEDDMYVLNPYELHQIKILEGGILLKMYVNVSFLRYHQNLLFGKRIFCCFRNKTDNNIEPYRHLQMCMARAFLALEEKSEENCYVVYAQALKIFEILYHFFSCTAEFNQTEEDTERMQRITEYVELHYMDSILLEEISSVVNFSPEYFSRYVRKKFGFSFSSFLKKIRLAHAFSQLVETKDSVTDIALENGFANVYSYISAFKEEHGCTPGEYRKKLFRKVTEDIQKRKEDEFNIVERKMRLLLQEEKENAQQIKRHLLKRKYQINIDSAKNDYRDSWREIIDGGCAKDLLMPTLQKQIEKCQKTIEFRYLCIRNIFDERMEFNRGFDYIDMLLDFASSLQLMPYFVLTAEAGGEEMLQNKTDQLLRHCRERYGLEKMRGWRISVEGIDGYDFEANMICFWQCYSAVWKKVKETFNVIKIGGPCGGISNQEQINILDSFLSFCKENGCFPDFITFRIKTPDDEIASLEEKCRQAGIENLELIAERYEAANTVGDPKNDGAYNAAHFAEYVIRYGNRLHGICYCPTSDYSEKAADVSRMFFGGRGVLNYDGIPKCIFHVWEYLKYMEGKIIAQGEEYILTEKNGQYRLLLSYPYEMTEGKASNTEYEITFLLAKIESGEYEIECCSAGEEAGSAYDAWLYLGKPERTAKHARAQAVIERIADSLYALNYQNTEDNQLELTVRMKPNDVMMVIFHRV